MILEATHRTRYTYPCCARHSHNEVRLMPLSDTSQTCISFVLNVRPYASVFSYWTTGGMIHHFSILEPHEFLDIEATTRVETFRSDPFEGIDLLTAEWDFYGREDTRQSYTEFLTDSLYVRQSQQVRQIAYRARQGTGTVVDFLVGLNTQVNSMLEYDTYATNVHSTVDDVLKGCAGVCQDYAHLMIACCRAEGVPARYVSGYLYGGPGLRGESATHAWMECLLPDGQWLALDPTNNLVANDHHIRVHIGRDYADVSPTRGVYVGPSASSLDVSVAVTALEPSLTR